MYHIDIKTLFQLFYLPIACEAFSRSIYIPATIELTNSDPTIILHKCFLGFDMTYMNIIDYQLMELLNVVQLTMK